LDADVKALETEVAGVTELVKLWKDGSLDELNKKYAKQLPRGTKITEELRRPNLMRHEQLLAIQKAQLTAYREERDAAAREKAGLTVEQLSEERRISAYRAKLNRLLADCDLLLIPRLTLLNVTVNDAVPNRVHYLDKSQLEAIKDFIKAGKPVLACFGPTNESPEARMPPPESSDDLQPPPQH